MFDDRNISDLEAQMKSILADAQEEVPAHVWDGISTELDKIAAAEKKPVMLWFRRAAIASAVAATVAAGLFVDWEGQEIIIPEAGRPDMIAVASEPETLPESADFASIEHNASVYIADAGRIRKHMTTLELTGAANENRNIGTDEDEGSIKAVASEENPVKDIHEEPAASITTITKEAESLSEEWEESEKDVRKRPKASIVLSGIASTNSVQNNNGRGATRLPSISTINPTTGVKQTKDESSYGLPLSVGAGVKFRLSPHWSLGIGANYTMLSRRFKGTYTKVGSDGNITVIPESDIRNSQHYIGIPVNVYYNIVNKEHLNFYTYLGGSVEKCISDRYDVLGSEIIHREKVNGAQLSANLGIGVEFLLGKHLGLYIDPSLRYYFDNSQPKSIRTVQPLMMGLEMGLRINL